MSPRILLMACLRDEGPHLLEWLAHHRAAGTTDVLVFSNDCRDGSDALLDRLDAEGALVHVRNAVPVGRSPQWSALRQAARHPLLRSADWILHLDADEFVNLRPPLKTLRDLVAAAPGADAIVLPWRLFGHDGHATAPPCGTLSGFTRAIAPDALFPPLARFVKTLYRRAGPFAAPGIHRPRQAPGAIPAWVDGSGARLPDAFAAQPSRILLWGAPLATDLVQLDHYSVRSAAEFLLKRARGLPNRQGKPVDLGYWVERNFNAVEDRTVERMLPATRAELARLRALPGVAELEAAARRWHDAALARILGEADGLKLYGRLLLAAGSVAPDPALSRHLVGLWRSNGPGAGADGNPTGIRRDSDRRSRA